MFTCDNLASTFNIVLSVNRSLTTEGHLIIRAYLLIDPSIYGGFPKKHCFPLVSL